MIAVVYSKATGVMRRVIAPAGGLFAPGEYHIAPGEAVFLCDAIDLKTPADLSAAESEIEKMIVEHRGGVEIDRRDCAVIAGGWVVSIISADPAIDRVEGRKLALCPKGTKVGDYWSEAEGFRSADA